MPAGRRRFSRTASGNLALERCETAAAAALMLPPPGALGTLPDQTGAWHCGAGRANHGNDCLAVETRPAPTTRTSWGARAPSRRDGRSGTHSIGSTSPRGSWTTMALVLASPGPATPAMRGRSPRRGTSRHARSGSCGRDAACDAGAMRLLAPDGASPSPGATRESSSSRIPVALPFSKRAHHHPPRSFAPQRPRGKAVDAYAAICPVSPNSARGERIGAKPARQGSPPRASGR